MWRKLLDIFDGTAWRSPRSTEIVGKSPLTRFSTNIVCIWAELFGSNFLANTCHAVGIFSGFYGQLHG
jgi:hypothetical protein